jgi:hypothetical protein
MVVGPGRTVGDHMINDPRLAMVSFTGSSEVRCVGGTPHGPTHALVVCPLAPPPPSLPLLYQIGVRVSEVVHRRFGRTILELGGNNATVGAFTRPPGPAPMSAVHALPPPPSPPVLFLVVNDGVICCCV